MELSVQICVVVPVYNHALTLSAVVRGAQAQFPVIAVNDGSTDDTANVLAREPGITIVTLDPNRGKGAALRAGFAKAGELGFTHAITIDADGQHPTSALGDFAAACRRQPAALIIGVRDFKEARAPMERRATNALSNLCFHVETGVPLGDTQCGYRCYPLAAVNALSVKSERYAFELEIMVKAAWAGIPLLAQPVAVDYAAPTSRLSHFDPWRDLTRISCLHGRLLLLAIRHRLSGQRPREIDDRA
jgi:glycosyltransferase involved in cell wall biosynthesis